MFLSTIQINLFNWTESKLVNTIYWLSSFQTVLSNTLYFSVSLFGVPREKIRTWNPLKSSKARTSQKTNENRGSRTLSEREFET